MTINNDLQIIESALGNSKDYLSDFNKNWFRLVPGQNIIDVKPYGILVFSIVFTERFKVGG
jgi:hypothetical protein